jgi:hypothetical protein
MMQVGLVVIATLGLSMTLIAVLGFVLVAGLRWARIDTRWDRTRFEAFAGNVRSWLGRGRWLGRLVTRGLWPTRHRF